MAQIIDLDAMRPPRPVPGPTKASITRSPELAFVLAIVKALPKETRSRVLFQVAMMAEHFPDCESAQEAGELARIMSLKLEGDE